MRPWLLALLCAACAGDKVAEDTDDVGSGDTDTDTDTDADTDTDTDTDTDGLAFTVDPTVTANDFGAGLTAWLDVQTTAPATLEIEVTDPGGSRTWTVDESLDAHHHLLLGLWPAGDNTITVTAHGDTSSVTSDPLVWTTGPLPEGPAFVTARDPSLAVEPGVTIVASGGHIWMVDEGGQVVWYLPGSSLIHQVGITERGTLLYQIGRSHIEEIALSGEILVTYRTNTVVEPATAIEVDRPGMHHDVFEMPSGNFLTLGIEDRIYSDYPASETDPIPTDPMIPVAGDTVLEFDPTGAVVNEWPLLDRLDPYRIAYNGLVGDYWDAFFPYPHINDWSHGNAIAYDEVRDEVIVSLRHQDAVIALDHATGDLAWIFAPTAHWNPGLLPLVLLPQTAADEPAYHQHAASITPGGNLLMFDNGNDRASAWEPKIDPLERYSRCLEVSLDPTAGTWTTVWSWGEDLVDNHFSGSLGDCDLLPQTGNHLITYGNLANPVLPGSRVYEVDAAGQVVWELSLEGATPEIRPTLYRAERVTDVIPGR